MRSPKVLAASLLIGLAAARLASGEAELRIRCEVFDDCYCHPSDGEVDPAELINLHLLIENVGDAPAADITGVIEIVSGGDAFGGAGSFGPLPTPIRPGEIFRRVTVFRVTADCGTWVDVDVTGLGSSSAPGTFPDELEVCDLLAGSGGNCESCCLPVDIEMIRPIYLVKARDLVRDVLLAWGPDPAPSASHYNTWMVEGAANKSHIPEARQGGAWPVVPGCLLYQWPGCRHSSGLSGDPGAIVYYQVRGVCDRVEAVE